MARGGVKVFGIEYIEPPPYPNFYDRKIKSFGQYQEKVKKGQKWRFLGVTF